MILSWKIAKAFLLLLISTISFLPSQCNGENILFFFGLSTYSHRITAWPLAVELAEKGHSVTFLQPVVNRAPHPKIKDFNPTSIKHVPPPNLIDIRLQYGKLVPIMIISMLPTWGADVCEQFLNSTENIEWVKSQKFDVVVMDALHNDCSYGLAHYWKAKMVVFGTTHVFDWFPDEFGFSDESCWIPGIHFTHDLPLNFLGRTKAAISYLYTHFMKHYRGLPRLDKMLREKLDMPEMPPVADLITNTSLVLINTHFSEELARSLPPFVVPIGGMHVSEDVKPLPQEMEKFIQASGDNGFMYVSFGSEADMSVSPQYIRDAFFNALLKSKAKYLWRWSGERPKDMPDNVLTANWMPQQDVLGHKKCKGFITHGGLLSMQEAVMHGVPMIVVPIFAEQDYNAERLHRTGRGIKLDLGTITEEQLENAIHRLLTDTSIKHQMTLAQKRFKDRPAKPVETAVWWTEYILRHEDTSFLRPLSISLNWYERRQIDVWAFIGLISFLTLYILGKTLTKMASLCCGGSSKKVSKTKKRN